MKNELLKQLRSAIGYFDQMAETQQVAVLEVATIALIEIADQLKRFNDREDSKIEREELLK